MDNAILNGVDTDQVKALAGKIQEVENYGDFKFRVRNEWISGSRNRTSIDGFFAGGQDQTSRRKLISVSADQPDFLGGEDTAPNPVEHYLHSLASCLTTTLIYHASVNDISVEDLETSVAGDLNAKGFFGISDQVSKGYERIKVVMRIKSNATAEVLKQLAMYSPVYEMVSKAVPVELNIVVE
jgi:uncharacterized OsmC-like protein